MKIITNCYLLEIETKNPNWVDNWREKRNPNYGTTKQKDNYIIKNFVFEEIIVGG
jgi:hypothetical protein